MLLFFGVKSLWFLIAPQDTSLEAERETPGKVRGVLTPTAPENTQSSVLTQPETSARNICRELAIQGPMLKYACVK